MLGVLRWASKPWACGKAKASSPLLSVSSAMGGLSVEGEGMLLIGAEWVQHVDVWENKRLCIARV